MNMQRLLDDSVEKPVAAKPKPERASRRRKLPRRDGLNTMRPKFSELTVAESGSLIDRPGIICQEKLDGRWHEQEIGGNQLVGELMPTGFVPFDIIACNGQDLRREPLHFRLATLRDECRRLGLPQIATGQGTEFLEAILAKGGEGIVAKPAESYFGCFWTKVKRIQTLDVVVTDKHDSKQSVGISLNGQSVGRCSILGFNFGIVEVGDVIEVACHSLHPSGKLREPRFVRIRDDKRAMV